MCGTFTFPAGALSRKLGAPAQKRGFACARIIFIASKILHFTFYILHLSIRSFGARGHSPRLLRMTGGGARRKQHGRGLSLVTLSGAAKAKPRSRTGLARKRIGGQTLFCRVRNGSPFCTRSLHSLRSVEMTEAAQTFFNTSKILHLPFCILHLSMRSFGARGLRPRLLRMTGGGARRRARAAPALAQDDRGGVNILQYIQNFTFTILHFTFSCPGGAEAGRRRRARRCTVPPSPPW